MSESRNISLKMTRNHCPEGFEYGDNFDDTKTGSQPSKSTFFKT